MSNSINPFQDFIQLSLDLLADMKILSNNIDILTYSDVCKTFIQKYPQEYLNLYKSYIYVKKDKIKNYDYSVVRLNYNINIQNEYINIQEKNKKLIFNILFREWETITEENKKTIFDYLNYMNQLIETYQF